MIEVRHLTKCYAGRPVLSDVSLRVGSGEVVAVFGPSGGGKTTLLRCLTGLEVFDAGEVRIAGETLVPGHSRHNRRISPLIRRKVGMLFQQWHLFAHRSVLGNVLEGPLHVRREPKAEALKRAEELLAKVGVSHRRQAYPHELSGGEQQRAAIARALAMRPEALLLDEPTSALDPERVDGLIELCGRLRDEGLTLLVVTHERRFARAVASRAVLLDEGKVLSEGPAAEVLDR